MATQTWRRVLFVILVPLTCLAIVASTVTIWVHRRLLDTDRWVATVAPLIDDPRITNPLSAYLADQMVTTLQVESRAEQALPAQAAFLAGPLAESTGRFVQTQTVNLLSSDQGQQVWETANRIGHERLVALLRGESRALGTADGMVTLDLLSLAAAVVQRIEAAAPGLIPRRDDARPPTPGLSADEQRRDLAQRTGLAIPANFGQIPLFPESQLDGARRALQTLDTLVIALPLIAIVLFIGALLVAGEWRQAALVLAIGAAVTFLLARILLPQGIDVAVAQVDRQAARDVVDAALGILVERLGQLLTLGAVLSGIAAVVLAFVARGQRMAGAEISHEPELVRPSQPPASAA